jgi:hypothetical protein
MSRTDSTTTVASAGIAATSPLLGDYGVILLAAVLGAAVALSRMQVASRRDALLFLFRAVAISSMLAGVASAWLSAQIGADAGGLLAPVAFVMAVIGDGWFRVRDWLIDRLTRGGAA